MMVCGNCRAVSELHVFTVTCHAIDAASSRCVECVPHVLSSLAECFFVLCVAVWDASMVTRCTVVILFLAMTLRSSSDSLMAA